MGIRQEACRAVRLEQNPWTAILDGPGACNMDDGIDTSPTPLIRFSGGRAGVVGARPTGLDWLTRLASSHPTSPGRPTPPPLAPTGAQPSCHPDEKAPLEIDWGSSPKMAPRAPTVRSFRGCDQ
ncbi:hypothetical protein KM043_009573 [Ampulex compressa]|nr:hypothetical protein KM043_009573 [Ampulex compressa]